MAATRCGCRPTRFRWATSCALPTALAPVSCVSQTAYQPCTDCPDEATCAIRLVMKKARDAIADVLDQTSVADLRNQADRATPLPFVHLYDI
ncbi:MAG: Rrf2 family transcriptional regulator [Kiritimatiellia bacterium]